MIGKILMISDQECQTFIGEAIYEWNRRGYDIEVYDFNQTLNKTNLNDYILIALTMGHANATLYHEYGQIIRNKVNIPIVFFPCGDFSVQEKIDLYEAGADEVISIPTNVNLAVTCCMALIRRYSGLSESNSNSLLLFSDRIILEIGKFKVIVDGKEIKLRKKEYEILYYLMENQDMIMSYEQILRHVWGDDYFDSCHNILWNQICDLRKKIQWKPDLPKYIISERGRGYSFSPHK